MEPIKSANRANEARKHTAAQWLGLVSEEFWAWATTHAAARSRNSRKGPPTARITVANPPFTHWIALILFQSTKWKNGREINKRKRKRGLYWRGFAPKIGLTKIQKIGSGLSKSENAMGKEKVFWGTITNKVIVNIFSTKQLSVPKE